MFKPVFRLFLVEVEFFSEQVIADFDTTGGDFHRRGDFFTGDMEIPKSPLVVKIIVLLLI